MDDFLVWCGVGQNEPDGNANPKNDADDGIVDPSGSTGAHRSMPAKELQANNNNNKRQRSGIASFFFFNGFGGTQDEVSELSASHPEGPLGDDENNQNVTKDTLPLIYGGFHASSDSSYEQEADVPTLSEEQSNALFIWHMILTFVHLGTCISILILIHYHSDQEATAPLLEYYPTQEGALRLESQVLIPDFPLDYWTSVANGIAGLAYFYLGTAGRSSHNRQLAQTKICSLGVWHALVFGLLHMLVGQVLGLVSLSQLLAMAAVAVATMLFAWVANLSASHDGSEVSPAKSRASSTPKTLALEDAEEDANWDSRQDETLESSNRPVTLSIIAATWICFVFSWSLWAWWLVRVYQADAFAFDASYTWAILCVVFAVQGALLLYCPSRSVSAVVRAEYQSSICMLVVLQATAWMVFFGLDVTG